MERDDRAAVATFFAASAASPLAAGSTVTLDATVAHHARVKRLGAGDAVRLTDGVGHLADGVVAAIRRDELSVTLGATIVDVERPTAIHLCVPVADRDRTLSLAEKATELGVASWRPVHFRRSSSVATRGEGPAFAQKLMARMIAALEQSGGAWLPTILPDVPVDQLASPDDDARRFRLLLDQDGPPLSDAMRLAAGLEPVILFGPEGGTLAEERDRLVASGWRRARLADTTLRFDTAGIAAVAAIRAMFLPHGV